MEGGHRLFGRSTCSLYSHRVCFYFVGMLEYSWFKNGATIVLNEFKQPNFEDKFENDMIR